MEGNDMSAAVTDDRDVIEVWEIQTEGTVWVWTKDVRTPGHMQKTRVGGKAGGSRRLRISRDERRFNEEQVIDEMASHNPFRNGALRFVSADDKQQADDIDTTYHMTNEDLLNLLEIKDEALLKSEVEGIASELVLRRLYMVAEKNATVAQLGIIRDVVDERYQIGGTQQSIREQDRPGYRGIQLS
jgi:hypothetical protein